MPAPIPAGLLRLPACPDTPATVGLGGRTAHVKMPETGAPRQRLATAPLCQVQSLPQRGWGLWCWTHCCVLAASTPAPAGMPALACVTLPQIAGMRPARQGGARSVIQNQERGWVAGPAASSVSACTHPCAIIIIIITERDNIQPGAGGRGMRV